MTAASRIAALTDRLGATPGLLFQEGPGGLIFVDVENHQARARLCLQGAQLTHWQPRSQAHPVLWLSAAARYAPGKAIRGGIPVCWPWFGAAAPGAAEPAPTGPAHGFARTRDWELTAARVMADGASGLVLQLADSVETRATWPAAFALELRITIGAALEVALTSRNTGPAGLVITEALHTYFRIGDIGAVSVHGLDGVRYFDSAAATAGAGQAVQTQDGPIRFAGEVDRVYDSGAGCRIEDPLLGRQVHISPSGGASTVVWNPWEAKSDRLGDVEAGGWRQMVCVESANARASTVHLAPGASHCLAVRYRVET